MWIEETKTVTTSRVTALEGMTLVSTGTSVLIGKVEPIDDVEFVYGRITREGKLRYSLMGCP